MLASTTALSKTTSSSKEHCHVPVDCQVFSVTDLSTRILSSIFTHFYKLSGGLKIPTAVKKTAAVKLQTRHSNFMPKVTETVLK